MVERPRKEVEANRIFSSNFNLIRRKQNKTMKKGPRKTNMKVPMRYVISKARDGHIKEHILLAQNPPYVIRVALINGMPINVYETIQKNVNASTVRRKVGFEENGEMIAR